MNTNFNYSKMRCKKLAYMLEDGIWSWFIPFTDHMNQLLPKHAVGMTHSGALSCNRLFIGSNDEPNGPN